MWSITGRLTYLPVLPARRYSDARVLISRRRLSVCVCLSLAAIVSKMLNVGSSKQRHVIAQGL